MFVSQCIVNKQTQRCLFTQSFLLFRILHEIKSHELLFQFIIDES